MNKIAIYVIAGLVALFLYYQFIGLVEDNAIKDGEISNLKEAARILGEDSKRKSKLNIERAIKISNIEKSNKVLQDDLEKIKTTPQQAKCDLTATPIGYADRVLKRTN